MKIHFTKMHGLGNDFIMIDTTTQSLSLTSEQLRWMADRHLGIGCDQILLVENSPAPNIDFGYRIFNADGQEVSQCGNGARCFARFVRDKGLTSKNQLVVHTASGLIYPHIEPDGQVTVNMGPPRFNPLEIPLLVKDRAPEYMLEIDNISYRIGAVSMGNPHAVLQVDSVTQTPVNTLGPRLESHPLFPQRVNAGFMQILNRSAIKLRVYERGVGETLACGTGACAAVVLGILWEKLNSTVQVHLPGGQLSIHWAGNSHPVFMTGPVTYVFEGHLEL